MAHVSTRSRVVATRYQDIDTGHRLCGHEGHCAHLHGHSYRVHFTCEGPQDELGRVIDFGIIKTKLCQWLLDNWDHRFLIWEQDPWLEALQDVDDKVVAVPFNPSAENMALYLLNEVGPDLLYGGAHLVSVRIEETRKCSAIAEL